MKFKKILFFSLIIFQSIIGQSQELNKEKKINNIKLNITSMFDPISSYRFSYEYYIGKKYNFENEIGYFTNFSPSIRIYIFGGIFAPESLPIILHKLNGVRFRTELKRFIYHSKNTREGFYYSYAVLFSYYKILADYTNNSGSDQYYYYSKNLKRIRTIFSYQQKIGYQINSKDSPLIFDFYFGIGVRALLQFSKCSTCDSYYESTNRPFSPTLNGGLRVGMLLNK